MKENKEFEILEQEKLKAKKVMSKYLNYRTIPKKDHNTTAVISIKTEHLDKIKAKEKTFELRRVFTLKPIKRIFFYETSPVKLITCYAEMRHLYYEKLPDLWERVKDSCGLTKSEFDEYFKGKEKGYAIQLKNIKKILHRSKTIPKCCFDLKRAPQSFAITCIGDCLMEFAKTYQRNIPLMNYIGVVFVCELCKENKEKDNEKKL